MKEKIKNIIIGVLIGVIAFPIITLGGTFVVSLIQGKTVEEAIQILAEQIDSVSSRLNIVETKQTEQKQDIEKLQEELQTQLFTIENKKVCDKLTSFEAQIGSLEGSKISFEKEISNFPNRISEIEQNYIQTKNYCQPFTDKVSSECLSLQYEDPAEALECCYKHNSPADYSDYPEGYPKTCCYFFYKGKLEKDNSIAIVQNQITGIQKELDDVQKQLSILLSDPEYLQSKEQCVK